MGDPTPLIILSFCDIQTTLCVSLTSTGWKYNVERFWNQTKVLVVHWHVSEVVHKKERLRWIVQYCRNLRVIDIRWCVFPVDLLVDLIQASPLLEIYLSSYGEATVFEAIYELCPHITGLGILHCNLPIAALSKFKSLTALELGHYTAYLDIGQQTLRDILSRNPNLQIVHILGFTNSFPLLESLQPDKLKSFSVPYEQDSITPDKVRLLKPFNKLKNINFGQSSYSDPFQVLKVLSQNHSHLRSLSFYSNRVQSERLVVSHIINGSFFPCLEILGCRIKPQTRQVYSTLSNTRNNLIIYDYEQTRSKPSNWCYPKFDLWVLMKKYGLYTHKQW